MKVFPFLENVIRIRDISALKDVNLKPSDGVVIVGLPWEGRVNSRFGTYLAPQYLRGYSDLVESKSLLWGTDLSDVKVFDLGDLRPCLPGDMESGRCGSLLEQLPFQKPVSLLFIGGDHSVTLYTATYCQRLFNSTLTTVLQLDAHLDMHDEYEGYRRSYASVMRRLRELGMKVIHFGTRTWTDEEIRELDEGNTLIPLDGNHAKRLEEVLDDLQGDLFLSIDVDVFSPALVPGVTNPVAGGLDWQGFQQVLKIVYSKVRERGTRVIGLDIVELNPTLDPTGRSSAFVSEVLRESLLMFHHLATA